MIHCKLAFMLPFAAISLLLIISWKAHGYAEIHYTLYGYSLLNCKQPEILVDMPWRVDAGNSIPVICIIKDADRFPVKLKRITVKYRIRNGEIREQSLLDGERPLYISDHYWKMLSFVELPDNEMGTMKTSIEVEYTRRGIKRVIVSDNLPGLSHAPFRTVVSPYKLPSFDGWCPGDSHYHSDMTQDQLEFGAPVSVAASMGRAMGLKWIVTADHSYDLDRSIGEYYEHDPKLTRWRRVRQEASVVNCENDDFVVISAEEVSCGNSRSHNIHLLAFDTPEFIPGSGDGVKRGLDKRPTLTLRQCLNRINQMGGFAYAAHPESGNGFMGILLLNRDRWRDQDYAQGGYSGLQFWNGVQGKEFDDAYKKWIQLLLEGRKLYILGGNDAHGDFNRCRKVRYPNTRLSESPEHVFGKTRTYAYCGTDLSVTGIQQALRNGRTIVTDGPVAIMQVQNGDGETAMVGDDITGREFTLTISVRSSEEFGSIDRIILYRGDFLEKIERVEQTFIPEKNEATHVFAHKMDHKSKGYVRVEAMSSARGKSYLCITNPIWLRSV